MRGILLATTVATALAMAPAAAIDIGAGGGIGAGLPGAGAQGGGRVGASAGFPAGPQAPGMQAGPGAQFHSTANGTAAVESGSPPAGGGGISVSGVFDRIGYGFSELISVFTGRSGQRAGPARQDARSDPRVNQNGAIGAYGDTGVSGQPSLGIEPRAYPNGPVGGQVGPDEIARAQAMLVGTDVVSADGAVLGTITEFGAAGGGHGYLGVELRDDLEIGTGTIRISTENAAFTGQGVQLGETREEFVVAMRSQLDAAGMAR